MAPTLLQQLHARHAARESEHLELKEAKRSFHLEKFAKYCAALARFGQTRRDT